MSCVQDLGDLPPPSALSLQTIRAKVEKRTSIDAAPCAGSGVAAPCKPAANCCSSSSISPKSSPVGENRRDGRRDSRDSAVPDKCPVFPSLYDNGVFVFSSVVLWVATRGPGDPAGQSLANRHMRAKRVEPESALS